MKIEIFERKRPPEPAPKLTKSGKKIGRPTRAEAERRAVEKRKAAIEEKRLRLSEAKIDLEIQKLSEGHDEDDDIHVTSAQERAVLRRLREDYGLRIVHKDGQGVANLDGLSSIVREVAPMLKEFFAGAGQRFTNGVPIQAVGMQPVQLPAGQPTVEQSQSQEDSSQMDFLTLQARMHLEGKAAPERAAWLAALPMLADFIGDLCRTEDAGLMKRVETTAAQVPMYRGVMTWIGSRGEPWVIETVTELRKLMGIAA